MNEHELFPNLCNQARQIVTDYINQLVLINVDHNTAIKELFAERVRVFEFVMKLRLDFQPLFITDSVVDDLWEEIRTAPELQEMISTVTFKMLTQVNVDFHNVVARIVSQAVEAMAKTQGALDADYYERIVATDEIEMLVSENPWFALVLLIALGREEYVKPAFAGSV